MNTTQALAEAIASSDTNRQMAVSLLTDVGRRTGSMLQFTARTMTTDELACSLQRHGWNAWHEVTRTLS